MSDNTENSYARVYQQSLVDREAFWKKAAENIEWVRPFDRVLDDSDPPHYRWFVGGELNTCFNAVDVHVYKFL